MKKEHVILTGLALTGIALTFLIIRKSGGPGKKKSAGWIAPVTGKLTSGFGSRKDPTNPEKVQVHNGQDVAVPIGTPVVSPMEGEIASTTSTTEGGNQVIIRHSNGFYTGYAHLSKILVNKGQRVKQGFTTALSGNTGAHTTGPHVHVTMTDTKGVKINPRKYLFNKV